MITPYLAEVINISWQWFDFHYSKKRQRFNQTSSLTSVLFSVLAGYGTPLVLLLSDTSWKPVYVNEYKAGSHIIFFNFYIVIDANQCFNVTSHSLSQTWFPPFECQNMVETILALILLSLMT